MAKKIIIGRILGRPPEMPGKIAVMDAETGDIYTLDRMSDRRLIKIHDNDKSGYKGLLYEFEITTID